MCTSFRFPIGELMSEERCYEWLVEHLHPEGLRCPEGHDRPEGEAPHTRNRAPIVEYRCRTCGHVYNVFTDTVLNGIRYSCPTLVLILRGFLQGETTAKLAAELGIDRMNLLRLRHDVQAILSDRFPPSALRDKHTEADEMYQNAGEKGVEHLRPGRSTTAPGQQAAGARQLRQRPPPGAERGRP